MRKVITFVLILVLSVTAFAEYDFSNATDEELYRLREKINWEIATRLRDQYALEEGKSISDLFPDKILARYIRDKIGAFTENDIVTQEQLNKVRKIEFTTYPSKGIVSLEGIQYLQELRTLTIYQEEKLKYIPQGIGNLTKLESIWLEDTAIQYLPNSICNLTSLVKLNLSRSPIQALPNDIGNLINLKELDISHTQITFLPRSIYNLKLDFFNRNGLDY